MSPAPNSHLLHQNNTNIFQQILQTLLLTTNINTTDLSDIATKTVCNLGAVEGLLVVLLCAAAYVVIMELIKHVVPDKKNKVRNNKVLYSRSMSIGALHGGQLAIERLVEYHDARANRASLQSAENELESLLNEDRPDFKKLQRVVGRLEMSGKERMAVERLEDAVKTARMQGKPHEAYEFDMLLVEVLIYKGDFKKALGCLCLKDESITDARRPLYKAIIHLLLEDCNEEEVRRLWKEFRRIQKHFRKSHSSQATQLHDASRNFVTFKNIVMSLKDDIRHTTNYTMNVN